MNAAGRGSGGVAVGKSTAGEKSLRWGPAGYQGWPPGRLIVEGLALAVSVVTFTAGAGWAGVVTGMRAGAVVVGAVATVGLVAYLFTVGAGQVFLGAVAVLGWGLCWWVPADVEAGILAERGVRRSVVVTEVQEHRYESRDYSAYSCSVALDTGEPIDVSVGSACDRWTEPGDRVPVVVDPRGVAAPVEPPVPESIPAAVFRSVLLSGLLAAVTMVAVVRTAPDEEAG